MDPRRSLEVVTATLIILLGASAGGLGCDASAGASGTGGAIGMGGAIGSGGTMASGGAAGSGGAIGTGGVAGTGGVSNGGTGGSGAGGVATGGSSGSGGAAAGCTRDFLKTTVDTYFVALAGHSASALPLAGNVKFTENGQALRVGQDGLWKTAGARKFAVTAFDTDGCNTASEAVVPDGSTDIPFALRLRLQNQQITEIETIAARPGDYKVNGAAFASDTGAIIASDTTVHWQDTVPAAQRNTVQEINAWMDKYFKVFPAGVCNTASSCKRLENGGGSFSCSAGASCSAGPGTGAPVIKSHVIFADVETGIGIGFDNFMSNCDMHMFKMYGGTVYAVHAVLGGCSSTGWD